MNSKQKLIVWMRIIAILAIIVSIYLLYLHYSETESFCDITKGLSCDIVNKSIYSEFPPASGIPVSLLGAIVFIAVLFLLRFIEKNKKFSIIGMDFDSKKNSKILFYLMVFGLLFALYLVYTELVLILSICIMCVVLDIFIITLLVLSYRLKGVVHGKK